MIRVAIFVSLLLALAFGLAQVHAQEPPTTTILFSWSFSNCQITQTIDPLDFDTDAKGERYYVIKSFGWNCFPDRDVTFDFTPSDGIKRVTTVTKAAPHIVFNILLFTRLTEQRFAWNLTPQHVDTRPGSVSAPAWLTVGGNASGNAVNSTAAFTPTANALLVGAVAARNNGAVTYAFTYTDSHTGSGAWTQQATGSGAAVPTVHMSQPYAQMGATPGSGTVTITYGANATRSSWIFAEVVGHDTVTPLSEFNVGGATTGTTLSISIAGVAAGNQGVGTMVAIGTAAITVGTGETEVIESNSTGTNNTRTQMQYSTDANQNWAWTGSNHNYGIVIEYAAASGAAAAQVIMID